MQRYHTMTWFKRNELQPPKSNLHLLWFTVYELNGKKEETNPLIYEPLIAGDGNDTRNPVFIAIIRRQTTACSNNSFIAVQTFQRQCLFTVPNGLISVHY